MGKYGTIIIDGEENENDGFGFSVSGIGDINGDGLEDFAVSERYGRTEYAGYYGEGIYSRTTGTVYVVFGTDDAEFSINVADIDGTNGFEILADPDVSDGNGQTTFGHSVVGLGDVNGDNIDDFAIVENGTEYSGYYGGGEGGYYYNNYYSAANGVAYVVYGGQTPADSAESVIVTDLDGFRIDAEGEISEAVALGDINGDGIADVGLNTSVSTDERVYTEVLYFYDANSNGYYDPDDETNPEETGFFETRDGGFINDLFSYVIYGTDAERESDDAIIEAGQSTTIVNTNELEDTDGFSIDAGQEFGGGFYGIEGPGVGLQVARSSVIGNNDSNFDDVRTGIIGVADLDGDGFVDILVGNADVADGYISRYRQPGQEGYYYGYDGAPASTFVTETTILVGAEDAADMEEISTRTTSVNLNEMAMLGDVSDNDNFDELAAIGFGQARDLSEVEAAGVGAKWGVFVLNGSSDILDDAEAGFGELDFLDFGAAEVNDGTAAFYYAHEEDVTFQIEGLLGLGDFNGDGLDDFLINGIEFGGGLPSRTVAYIVNGTEDAASGQIELNALVAAGDAYRVELDQIRPFEDIQVATAGDVDGDGSQDIILGDSDANNSDGIAQVIFGGESFEAADAADGTDDNVVQQSNLIVNVETGLVPVLVSLANNNISVVSEGADGDVTNASFTVQRNGDLSAEVTVDWAVQGGGVTSFYDDASADDFEGGVLPSGTVTFATGESTATVDIPVADDDIDEDTFEDFSVVISNPTTDNDAGASINGSDTIRFYIQDDEIPAELRTSNASVIEGNPGDDVSLVFTITRSGDVDSEVTVDWVAEPYRFSASIQAEPEDFEGGLNQSGTVTFAAGETTKTVELAIAEDAEVEGTEYVTFELSNPTTDGTEGVSIISGPVFGAITNDDLPAQYSVNDTQVTETDADDVTMTFTITRSGDTNGAGTVDYRLQSGGVLPDDFTSGYIDPTTGQLMEGTIEFADGETTKTITLEVAGDDVPENNEQVYVRLSNATSESPNGAGIIDNFGVGTILNDDLQVQFSINDANVNEGDEGDETTMTFTVFRSSLLAGEASIDYSLEAYPFSNAADADDFVSGFPQSGTLTFADGETTKTITVVVSGDDDVESREFLQVTLSNPVAPDGETAIIVDATAFGSIFNDDLPVIYSATGANVSEGDSGETTDMIINVFRSGDTSAAGTLDYSVEPFTSSQTADDDDLVGSFNQTGTVSFAAGQTQKTITIEIQGDDDQEANEFLQVFFSNPTSANGTQTQLNNGSVFGTITNDDFATSYTTSNAFATEGQAGDLTPLVFTISRFGDLDHAGTVDYELAGYALSPDFTAESNDIENGLPQSGTVEFAEGESFKQLTFMVQDDEVFEGVEYVQLMLSNASTPTNNVGSSIIANTALGTITDDESPVYFSVSSDTVLEGDEGETTALEFVVTRSGDTSVSGTVDYQVSSYFYSGATNDDLAGAVTLPISGSLTFAAGITTQTIQIDVAGDNVFEGTEYLQVDLSNPATPDAGQQAVLNTSRAYGYITDDDTPTYFRVYGFSANEGDEGDSNMLTFTVSRFGDTSGAAEVDYDIAGGTVEADDFDAGAWPTSGTVSFGAGVTSVNVSLPIAGDVDIENDEYTYMTLSNPVSLDADISAQISTGTASAVIRNDDFPAKIAVTYWTTVTEGDDSSDARVLSFAVTRSGDTTSEVSVDYNFEGQGFDPLSADDFEGGLPQSGTLTFAAGQNSQVLSFAVAEDEEIEGNERARITLSNETLISGSADATVEITNSVGYGVVYNDDFAPSIRVLINGSQWGANVTEGNSGTTDVTLTFQRDGNTDGELTVDYDLTTNAGSVFAADSQDIVGFLPSFGNSVTFADGETTATATVSINGDGLIEANESFRVQVTGYDSSENTEYTIENPTTTISIRNDDGRPPIPELPFDVDGDGVIEEGEFIRVEADVFGDPHIITLDGLGYDFQAVGEYVLVETVDGAENPFSVQVRFEAFPGSDLVSVTTRMSVEVKGKTIEVDAMSPDSPLMVDGVAVDMDAIALSGFDLDDDTSNSNDIFVDEDGKIFIQLNPAGEVLMIGVMDGSLNVCVFLAGSEVGGNAGAVRGLMGNANQDLTDDYEMRDGSDIPEAAISFDDDGVPALTFDFVYGFGEYEATGGYRASWAIAQDERLFSDDAPDFPENFPAGPVNFDELPDNVRAAASLAADAAGITDPILREAAILDFALTGDGDFIQGVTQLAADPTAASDTTENPDSAPAVGIAANAVSVVEGDSGVQEVTYTVYRTGGTAGSLEVNYEILGDVNADDLGTDTPLLGSVSFADGETEQTLSILVKGDLATEADESLLVRITGTDNEAVLVSGSQGSTTITTDDFGPVAQDDNLGGVAGEAISGNVFDDNGQGDDTDADGDSLTVVSISIDGTSYTPDESPVSLADGSTLTFDADGNFELATGNAYDDLPDGDFETFEFSYVVSDGNGGLDEADVTLSIAGTDVVVENLTPTVQDSSVTVDEDVYTYLNFLEGANDPEGAELSVTIVDGADNGEVFFDQEGWVYQSNQDYNGDDSFSYTVSDGVNTSEVATVSITVSPVNDAPVANDDTLVTDQDTSFNGNVILGTTNGFVADTDVDNDTLSVIEVQDSDGNTLQLTNGNMLPEGGTLAIGTDGAFFFDPLGDFDGLGAGEMAEISFTYTITDGFEDSTASVSITINGLNDAPVAVDDDAATDADTAITIDVADNDTDVDSSDLNATAVDLTGTLGIASVNADGSVNYDPNGAFATLALGATATDSFTYTVSDGDLSSTATVSVEIEGTFVEEPGKLEITGTTGRNTLNGTTQDEIIEALAGSDRMTGGGGEDEFVFNGVFEDGRRDRDIIYDFDDDDVIVLDTDDYTATLTSRYVGITSNEGDLIMVVGRFDSVDDVNIISPEDLLTF